MEGITRDEELEARRLYSAQYVKPAATPSEKDKNQMLQGNETEEMVIDQPLKQDQLDVMKNQKYKAVMENPQAHNAFLERQCLEIARLCQAPQPMARAAFEILYTCVEAVKNNGGIMPADDLLKLMNSTLPVPVPEQRLLDVLKSLQPFGIQLLSRNNTVVVKSVPDERSMDILTLMHLVATPDTKYRVEDVCGATGWPIERAKNALEGLVELGFLWIDNGPGGERAYWNFSKMA